MLSPEHQSARMSKVTNDGLNPVWHKMLLIYCVTYGPSIWSTCRVL